MHQRGGGNGLLSSNLNLSPDDRTSGAAPFRSVLSVTASGAPYLMLTMGFPSTVVGMHGHNVQHICGLPLQMVTGGSIIRTCNYTNIVYTIYLCHE